MASSIEVEEYSNGLSNKINRHPREASQISVTKAHQMEQGTIKMPLLRFIIWAIQAQIRIDETTD